MNRVVGNTGTVMIWSGILVGCCMVDLVVCGLYERWQIVSLATFLMPRFSVLPRQFGLVFLPSGAWL